MKSKLFRLAKLIISAIIFYFLFRKIELREVWGKMNALPWQVFLFIMVTALIKQVIEISTWFFMLCLNPNYKPKLNEILRSHFVGQSLRFLIPGGHAIVGKLYFVDNKKKASIVAIGAEKFFQVWIILFFASFAAFFHFNTVSQFWRILVFSFIIFIPLIIYFMRHLFSANKQIFFKNYFSVLPKVLFAQTLYMLITITQYFVVLNSFSEIPYIHVFLSVPLILTANIIPFTYAGLGLRETFAITVLATYSINSANAVSVSLIVFLFNTFLPALVGLGLFWGVKKKQS
jgi:uncharacterized membrane protein YbhN (UPF0104 family)